jgi:hypothetical protein
VARTGVPPCVDEIAEPSLRRGAGLTGIDCSNELRQALLGVALRAGDCLAQVAALALLVDTTNTTS